LGQWVKPTPTNLFAFRSFILELGAGISFVARQKRMTVDDEDYYLDLLFYYRKLRRLVAIDLKLGKFQARTKARWSFTFGGWKNMSNKKCQEMHFQNARNL
jgi:hypothetical protein